MAGVQFAQQPHMHPQQGGYAPNQQMQYDNRQQIHHNNHAPQMHMQQPQHNQQQYMQNHNTGHQQQPMHDQQQYYHDRVDGKSAVNEQQLIEQKMQEIQALRYEVESLQKANDPNQSAAQMAERLAQQPDPFNEDSEWNLKPRKECCIIQ